jgi:hypothetical protein
MAFELGFFIGALGPERVYAAAAAGLRDARSPT